MTTPVPRAEAETSDGVLVRRVADRDGSALEALYDRYGPPAFALARRITGEPAVAQDVVQDVFLALWREPAQYDPARGRFPSWLLASTHHKAVDTVRRGDRARFRRGTVAAEAPWSADGSATDLPPVEDATWDGLRGQRARQALAALPPPQREALVLAYYAGYTQREIAEETGTPLGTVRSRMLAGMRRLRDVLDGVSDPERLL